MLHFKKQYNVFSLVLDIKSEFVLFTESNSEVRRKRLLDKFRTKRVLFALKIFYRDLD